MKVSRRIKIHDKQKETPVKASLREGETKRSVEEIYMTIPNVIDSAQHIGLRR